MRLIMNVLIILPYYLAFVHGLVIPRDELGGLGISSCNGLDTCFEIADSSPPLNKLDDTPLESKDINWGDSKFVTSYEDTSGNVQHLDFNPAVLNDGILGQLQPNPFKLNQNFIDQLNQLIQPEPIVVPMTESFDPSVNDDDIWNTDNFNILS